MLEIEIKACWSLSSYKRKGWKILNQSTDGHQADKGEGWRILFFEIETKGKQMFEMIYLTLMGGDFRY